MREKLISFPIGGSGQLIIFQTSVVDHFLLHQQRRCFQKEAGGQLFAKIRNQRISIENATGPRRTDKRSRHSYIPDRKAEQIEILEMFTLGFHYVGDWHTHPEAVPEPSLVDRFSISECFLKSHHQLNGFLLVIVGNAEFPECLHVILHNGETSVSLSPIKN